MAFCTNCGSQVDEGVKFCPSCGQGIEAPAQAAQTQAAQTQRAQVQRPRAPRRRRRTPPKTRSWGFWRIWHSGARAAVRGQEIKICPLSHESGAYPAASRRRVFHRIQHYQLGAGVYLHPAHAGGDGDSGPCGMGVSCVGDYRHRQRLQG